ncbi:unnamed protein product [Didymodactylos carnosus]|uniref:RRM domain-containing protein n=1 Tax=Didymodactylos carnosus TaxID=1234261 RepID=A0A813RX91_9BILA|nr:unnamed protein product [Didymodactylos carnosus]CAF3570206.1 unnamed protein product [Didymodactylos carnosus]
MTTVKPDQTSLIDNPDEMEANEEQEEEDDLGSTSSDEGEMDDKNGIVNDEQQEAELEKMKTSITENPYNYQSYLDYIALSKKYNSLDHIRYSRQQMSDLFPLTEQLWLDWLKDEEDLLKSSIDIEGDRLKLVQLYEKAINDYLSIRIWLQYLQFSIGEMTRKPDGIDAIRNLFERSLIPGGLHVRDGILLWQAYLEVEQAILMGIEVSLTEQQDTININSDLNEKLSKQVLHVLNLYRRQLGLPLRHMSKTYDEYNEFCQQYKLYLPHNYHLEYDLNLKHDYDQGMKQLEEREVYEEQLISVNDYEKYIQFELGQKNSSPARIQCLYERAIVDHCLNGDLWLHYLDYVDENLKSKEFSEKLFERSLRNCPWIIKLWIKHAQALEFYNYEHVKIKSVYNRAFNMGLQNIHDFVELYLSFIHYLRRQYQKQQQQHQNTINNGNKQDEQLVDELRQICESASDQYDEHFSQDESYLFYNCKFDKYWAFLECKYFHQLDQARKIWNDRILQKENNTHLSQLWCDYYEMEHIYGDDKHCRKLLYRALSNYKYMDQPEVICHLLLKHEEDYGTLEQYKQAKLKTNEILKTIHVPKKQQQEQKPSKGKQQQQKQKKTQQSNAKQPKQERKNQKKSRSYVDNNTMDITAATTTESIDVDMSPSKQQQRKRKLSPQVSESNHFTPTVPKPATVDNDVFKIPALPGPSSSSVQKKLKSNNQPQTTTTSANHQSQPHSVSDLNSLTTVFVSNLPYDVNEDQIQQALSSAGKIKEVRLTKHWSGKSRGFGYVEFENEHSCRQALKLDRTLVNERPMFVSPCETDKDKSLASSKFKYSTSLEKNKLFITNLPFTITKEQLLEIFSKHGHVDDIRLVTFRSGKPKGLAYVDYDNEQSASHAILNVDGMTIEGHSIKVAISNPPQRKQQQQQQQQPLSTTNSLSLGGSAKSSGPRGKGYSQIALIPRKVTPKTTTVKPQASTATTTTTTTTTTTESALTNADFQKMFIKN